MKKILSAIVFGASLVGAVGAAHANYVFSGSGASGTLVSPSETWRFNNDGGVASTGYLNDWGTPGIGAGVVPYGESSAAYGIIVTFAGGGAIDAASIGIGSSAACVGSTGGGTTACTISPIDPWEAFQTAPDTIEFLAQSPTSNLTIGQDYFVNVFFDGATPTSFTGEWLTNYTPTPIPTSSSVPEPASLALVGVGLLAALAARRKAKQQ